MFHLINLWVVLAALAVSVTSEDCYNTESKGSDYRGTKATTSDGTECSRWDSGVYIESGTAIFYATEKFGGDSGVTDGNGRLCRNPVPDEQTEPWCYVVNDDTGFWKATPSPCGVPACTKDKTEDETKDETENETKDETENETRKQLENNSAMFSGFSLFLLALALLMSI